MAESPNSCENFEMKEPIRVRPWQRALWVALFVAAIGACLLWPQTLLVWVNVLIGPIGLGLLTLILILAAIGALTTQHRPTRRAFALVAGIATAAIATGLVADLATLLNHVR